MPELVNMPKLGFDMAEGTLVRKVKPEGAAVKRGETLAEIETDKATVEVESPATGVVRELENQTWASRTCPSAPALITSTLRRSVAAALPWLPSCVTTRLRPASSRNARASPTVRVSGFSQ